MNLEGHMESNVASAFSVPYQAVETEYICFHKKAPGSLELPYFEILNQLFPPYRMKGLTKLTR